jgi:hypothetical protein
MPRIIKNNIFFCFLLLTCFAACHKTEKIEVNARPILRDSIYYHDIVPDLILKCAQSYSTYSTPSGGCNKPMPVNYCESAGIDLNGNLSADITFSASNTFTQISVSGCGTDGYRMDALCSQLDSIPTANPLLYGNGNPFPYFFASGDTIRNNKKFRKSVLLKSLGGYWMPQYSFTGQKYIGIKRMINGNGYFGWILVEFKNKDSLKIKEYAINLTLGNTIRAGQVN